MTDDRVSFGSGSSRVMGGLTVLVALVVAGVSLVEGEGRSRLLVAAIAVLAAVLAWASMLRPALTLVGEDLVLRNMLETVTVPLAAISSIDVRQVVVVRAGRRKFTSSAIGRTRRQLNKDSGGGPRLARGTKTAGAGGAGHAGASYGALVEQQLRARVVAACDVAGVKDGSAEQEAFVARIERQRAVPEIAAMALALLAVVVLLVV